MTSFLPDIDWKTGLVNGNNYPHKTSEEIIKSGEDMFMEQVVECSTRGENILDLCRHDLGSPITAINGIIIWVKL
jgi:hypothetical protein